MYGLCHRRSVEEALKYQFHFISHFRGTPVVEFCARVNLITLIKAQIFHECGNLSFDGCQNVIRRLGCCVIRALIIHLLIVLR